MAQNCRGNAIFRKNFSCLLLNFFDVNKCFDEVCALDEKRHAREKQINISRIPKITSDNVNEFRLYISLDRSPKNCLLRYLGSKFLKNRKTLKIMTFLLDLVSYSDV